MAPAGPASIRRPILFGVVSACMLAAACGDAPEGADGVVVRDSAGIGIVENPGDVWSAEARWRLSAEPDLAIGVAEGDEPYLLDGVRGVLPLGDGRIVVANGGDKTLRWYDGRGVFLFRRGGAGDGPGEFSRLGSITLGAADTVIAVDWSARRLTTYTADGELGGTKPITGITGPPGAVYRLADGSFVMGVSGFSTAQLGSELEPGVVRVPSPLLRLAADGSRADTVGMFPGQEIEISGSGDGLRIGYARLGKSLSYAVDRDRIYIGTADRFVIDVLSADGERLRSIRAPDVDVTVGPAYEDAYLDFMRARLEGVPPEQRAEAERTIADVDLPETAPAYATFLVDSDGDLWVAEYRFDLASPERWAVFDPSGRLVTTVVVPSGFRVMAATHGRVLGRATDDLGVERVVGYTIVRGA